MSRLLWICLLLAGFCAAAQATFISAVPPDALQWRDHNPLDSDACPPGVITQIPVTITGNTSTSVHNYNLSCVSSSAGDDIYSIFLSCRALVTVSLCGSSYDTAIEARLGPENIDCPGTLVEACNDDHCGLQSQISFTVDPAQYTYIIVSGYLNHSGAYTMSITGTLLPPLNDHCDGPIPVTSLPYNVVNSTACATQGEDPSCSSLSSAPDVVYQILLPCDADVTATTCGYNGYDTILYVRTGGNCPGNDVVACNDDACGGLQSSITFHLLGGFPYYLWVDGFNNASGIYNLTITETHPIYGCPGITIPDTFYYATGGYTNCNGATGLPNCATGGAPQVVYNYTPAVCQTVGINTCGSFFNTVLQVRTGGGCPGNTLVACSDDYCNLQGRVLFNANAGQTYYFLVGGSGNASGLYFLTLNTVPCSPPHPVNDLVIGDDLENGIFLFWTPLPWADRYNIYGDTMATFPLDSAHWLTWTQGNSIFLWLPDSTAYRSYYFDVTWTNDSLAALNYSSTVPPAPFNPAVAKPLRVDKSVSYSASGVKKGKS